MNFNKSKRVVLSFIFLLSSGNVFASFWDWNWWPKNMQIKSSNLYIAREHKGDLVIGNSTRGTKNNTFGEQKEKEHLKLSFATLGILKIANEIGKVKVEERDDVKDINLKITRRATTKEDLERLKKHVTVKSSGNKDLIEFEGTIPENCKLCRVDLKLVAPRTQEVNFKSSTGDARFKNIYGKANIDVGNGNVTFDQHKDSNQPVEIKVNNGAINIYRAMGALRAQVLNGNISIKNAMSNIYARVAIGNIFVQKAKGHNGTIDIKTTVGIEEIHNK